jgi:hypothetical protein
MQVLLIEGVDWDGVFAAVSIESCFFEERATVAQG